MDTLAPYRCSKCGSHLIYSDRDEEDESTEAVCGACGNRTIIDRKPPGKVEIPREDIAIKQRKLPGISPREAQRLYRQSPAGKKAYNRYRYSPLFYLAHAKHRKTETYQETQRRFKTKRKLFHALMNPSPESTCPLNLFHKGPNGKVYHNKEACDFDGKNCKLGCIVHNGE